MKKLTCMVLILSILISCVSFVGCTLLSKDIEMLMKEDYVKQFNITDVSAEDVVVDYYVGKYSDYHIVMLDAEHHNRAPWEENIEGEVIKYYDLNKLYAWKDGIFLTLTEAYQSGHLSLKNISDITRKYNNDVRCYIDICDKYDFDEGYDESHFNWKNFWELFWEENKCYNQVNIWLPRDFWLDMKGAGDWSILIDYLGKDIVKEIFHIKLVDDFLIVGAELRMNNKNFLEYSIERLTDVPAVYLVDYFSKYGFADSAQSGNTDVSWD